MAISAINANQINTRRCKPPNNKHQEEITMIDLNNTYINCKELSADERMIYIKACIGDDLPHEKMCGYGSHSKDEILDNYLYYATFLYFSPSGMMSYDECAEPCLMTQQRIITMLDLKPEKEWENGDECIYSGDPSVIFRFASIHPNNKKCAIVWENGGDTNLHCIAIDCLSKPETPEQKAAREREGEIEKMIDTASTGGIFDDHELRWACQKLYDAGYRKPE